MRLPLALFSVLPFAAPLAAQTLTFAEGSPAGWTVVSVPETNPNAPDTVVLQNAEFLPVEITGRTLAQELDVTRSRLTTHAGVPRVELPGGGRLFRYRRAGGQFYGFLHVDAAGAAHVVFERPGVGTLLEDPFLDRIAVAADGRHAAIGRLAGGLFVVRLDGGVFASTGTPARQVLANNLDVFPASVMVGATVVWFLVDGSQNQVQVMRCDLADGAQPVDVTPPLVPNADFKDQLAMTRDGSRIVFLYGLQQQMRLYTCDQNGTSVALPLPPSKYEEANYLPEGAGEPAMLLNDSGTRLFYVDAQLRDELGLCDLTGVLPPLQITESTIFQPYIGTHILPKFAVDRLVVAIGDPAAMDWFRAELAPGTGTVVNLTGTGSLAQPFPSGTLDPVQAADANGQLLVVENQPGGTALRRIDPLSGAQTVLQQGVLGAPEVGSTNAGAPDVLVRSVAGESLYLGDTGALLGTLPPGLTLTAPVRGPGFAATWVALPNLIGCSAFYLPGGTLLTGPVEVDLKQICLTLAGGIVLNGSTVRYYAPGVSVVLNRPAVAARLCLSGAGG